MKMTCPRCGIEDDDDIPGVHLCSGMRRLTKEERAAIDLSPEAKARLNALFDDYDRCRACAAVEARTAFIG